MCACKWRVHGISTRAVRADGVRCARGGALPHDGAASSSSLTQATWQLQVTTGNELIGASTRQNLPALAYEGIELLGQMGEGRGEECLQLFDGS